MDSDTDGFVPSHIMLAAPKKVGYMKSLSEALQVIIILSNKSNFFHAILLRLKYCNSQFLSFWKIVTNVNKNRFQPLVLKFRSNFWFETSKTEAQNDLQNCCFFSFKNFPNNILTGSLHRNLGLGILTQKRSKTKKN